jgi:hypothetical protein
MKNVNRKKNGTASDAANGVGLRVEIEKRAYELWQADGGPHGDDLHYWLQAERDLTSGHITRSETHQTGI